VIFVKVLIPGVWPILFWTTCCILGTSAYKAVGQIPNLNSSQEIFSARAEALQIKIVLPETAIASLKKNPRTNVVAFVQEPNTSFSNVLVHLKGSTGSFRPVDEKPSFTLSFRDVSFHSLRKVHLNNSVEDPTYLNEYLGSELFRAVGLPAGRVAHARVELNGRNLGIYALKEGFSEDSAVFRNARGELYEPEPGHDVNEPLRLVFGDESRRSKLLGLAAAATERDLSKRWQGLQKVLDTDRFCSFMAMEILLNHRDGYCMGRNNFRLFHDVASDRFLFLPHGMDQLFGKADAALLPKMSGLVAAALMEIPEGRALYKLKVQQLTTNVFRVAELNRLVDAKAGLLQPLLDSQERQVLAREVANLKGRIVARQENVVRQIGNWSREQAHFAQGRVALTNWIPVLLGEKGRLEQNTDQGKPVLLIKAQPGSVASWKSRISLSKGRYRFSGLAKTSEVKVQRAAKSFGARLRIPGSKPDRSASLIGSQSWTKLEMNFDVRDAEHSFEFLCELSADQGEASFQFDSLFVEQVP
jgi:spore coat protein H